MDHLLKRLKGRERPLSTRELCDLIGRSRKTVERYQAANLIARDVTEGGRHYFSVAEVERFLRAWSGTGELAS